MNNNAKKKKYEKARNVQYASVYSGAFDTFLMALRWLQAHRWRQMRVIPVFAAESKRKRRKVLRAMETYKTIFKSTRRAAQKAGGRVDILTSCAQRGRVGGWPAPSDGSACTPRVSEKWQRCGADE